MKMESLFVAGLLALGTAFQAQAAQQCEAVIYRVNNLSAITVGTDLQVSPNPDALAAMGPVESKSSKIETIHLTMNNAAGHANLHLQIQGEGKAGTANCHVMFPYFGSTDSSLCGGNGTFVPKVDFTVTQNDKGRLSCSGEVVTSFVE
jgi:hypothetical protein